jgi:hypothetical protein
MVDVSCPCRRGIFPAHQPTVLRGYTEHLAMLDENAHFPEKK